MSSIALRVVSMEPPGSPEMMMVRRLAKSFFLLAEQPRVGRRRPEVRGLVVLHGPQQAVAGHGTNPNAERAELLCADDARAAHVQGEVHAMQVAVVRTHAGLPEQTRLGMHELVEVVLAERAHGGHARAARARGHVHHVVFGHAAQLAEEAADALAITFGLLVDERELLQVFERVDMRVDARFVPGALVIRAVLVRPDKFVLQALELQLFQLGTRHGLDFAVVVLLIVW